MSKLIVPETTAAFVADKTPVSGEVLAVRGDPDPVRYGDGSVTGGIVVISQMQPDPYVYGVDFNVTQSPPRQFLRGSHIILNNACDAVGNALRYKYMDSLMRMPCHDFRRCVISDPVTREVVYYLNPSDSSMKADGVTPADLTGGDGDVMVEIPVAYVRVDAFTDDSGDYHIVYLVSEERFKDSYIHPCFYVSPGGMTVRKQYIGAFRGISCDMDGNPVSDDVSFTLRSIAGAKPKLNVSASAASQAMSDTGYHNISELMHQYLEMMLLIDFATSDITSFTRGFTGIKAVNPAVIRNTGRTAVFGNLSGAVMADDAGLDKDIMDLTIADNGGWRYPDRHRDVQMSYRGIEDLWGCAMCVSSGVSLVQDNSESADTSGYWYTTDYEQYTAISTLSAGTDTQAADGTAPTGAACLWVPVPCIKATGIVNTFDLRSFYATSLTSPDVTAGILGSAWYSNMTAGCFSPLHSVPYVSSDNGGLFYTNANIAYNASSNIATCRISC